MLPKPRPLHTWATWPLRARQAPSHQNSRYGQNQPCRLHRIHRSLPLLSLARARDRPFPSFFKYFLLRSVVVHQLRQRFHRRRNLLRNILVHRGQQIFLLRSRLLLHGHRRLRRILRLRGNSFRCCPLISRFLRRQFRHLLPVSNFMNRDGQRTCGQRASQRPACRQPPTAPHRRLLQRPGPAPGRITRCRVTPGIHARLKVLQSLFDFRTISCQIVTPVHRVPLNSSRTRLTARERCAFTVPSLSPVVSAISLNSRSST